MEATLEKCNDLKCTPPEKATQLCRWSWKNLGGFKKTRVGKRKMHTQLCSFADQSSENLGGSKKSTVGTWKKKKNCTPQLDKI